VRSLCLALTNTEGSNARKQLFVVYMEATLGAMELITVNLINIKTAPPSHAHRHTPTKQTAFVVGKTEMSPRRSVCVCVSFVLLGGDKHLFPHKSALQMRCMFADHKSSPQTPVKKKSQWKTCVPFAYMLLHLYDLSTEKIQGFLRKIW